MEPEPTSSAGKTAAHCVPLAVFLLLLSILDFLPAATAANDPWYIQRPRHWLFPLQTVVCLGLLRYWWRLYEFRPHRGWLLAAGAGLLGILIWIAPGYIHSTWNPGEGWWKYLGVACREDGFYPAALAPPGSSIYRLTVFARFARMVIVVPLVEEIFWRGFLMRLLADPDGDFWKVPFGSHHPRSLVGVTLLFVLAHSSVDYVGALFFGLLMYGVCVRTKSLSACILMHAVANLILGVYVMMRGQWGYW